MLEASARTLAMIWAAKKIIIITHTHPDGDALSSACALLDWLRREGKDVQAYCHDPVPAAYWFLPGADRFLSGLNHPDWQEYDLFIITDCGQMKRTMLVEILSNHRPFQKIIEFDHHPALEHYADIEWRDAQAAATTEVIYDFFNESNIPISQPAATCILTGLVTDTAFFLYPSTTKKTVAAAAAMIRLGARLAKIKDQVWRNKNLSVLRLWGKAMAAIRYNPDYQIAYTVLTEEEIAASGLESEDLEGMAGFMSGLTDIKAFLFLRADKGMIRGSWRTNSDQVSAAQLAGLMNGGGHQKAAGFSLPGRILAQNGQYQII